MNKSKTNIFRRKDGRSRASCARGIRTSLYSTKKVKFFSIKTHVFLWSYASFAPLRQPIIRSGNFIVLPVPLDEARDAGLHGRVRAEAHGLFERLGVGGGSRHVAVLHRPQGGPGLFAEALLPPLAG